MQFPTSASALAILLFVTAGCSSTASVFPSGPVAARARAAGAEIINRTDDRVFYVVAEVGTLALLDLNPCVEVGRCPSVEARKTAVLPWSSVIGADAAKHDYEVIWWIAVTDLEGGRRRGSGGVFQFRRL